MLTIPTLFGRATTVLGQHASLEPLLVRLATLCDELARGVATSSPAAEQLLEKVIAQMAAHFAAEEDEGYFGTLAQSCPELESEISDLCAEHMKFLLTARWLLANVAACGEPAFAATLACLLERFNAHERAENRLLQQFFAERACGLRSRSARPGLRASSPCSEY